MLISGIAVTATQAVFVWAAVWATPQSLTLTGPVDTMLISGIAVTACSTSAKKRSRLASNLCWVAAAELPAGTGTAKVTMTEPGLISKVTTWIPELAATLFLMAVSKAIFSSALAINKL